MFAKFTRILTFIFSVLFVQMAMAQDGFDLSAADEAFGAQMYQEAFEQYEACYSADSMDMHCLERTAISAYRLGDIPTAKRYLHLAAEKDTANLTIINQLSSIYEQEKNIPKAIKYYTVLNKAYPENPLYYRKLAQLYQAAGLLTDAFKYYGRTLALNDKDQFAIRGLSELFIANQQYAEADSILRLGLAQDSLNVNFNLLMAQCQYKQKAFDSTVHYLEQINYEIDFSPYFNKMFGYAYIQIDSFEKSIPILEKALMDDGSKEYAHYYLAIAYEQLENSEYAQYHYGKAIEEAISNNIDLYHRSLAKMSEDQNRLGDAIQHYLEAYRYNADPLLLFYLARVTDQYYKDKSAAINYYKKYLDSTHNNESYRNYARERKSALIEERHFSN